MIVRASSRRCRAGQATGARDLCHPSHRARRTRRRRIPIGGKITISVLWNTKNVKGTHTITVTSDFGGLIDELNETNNVGKLVVKVKDNKVTNGRFTPGGP